MLQSCQLAGGFRCHERPRSRAAPCQSRLSARGRFRPVPRARLAWGGFGLSPRPVLLSAVSACHERPLRHAPPRQSCSGRFRLVTGVYKRPPRVTSVRAVSACLERPPRPSRSAVSACHSGLSGASPAPVLLGGGFGLPQASPTPVSLGGRFPLVTSVHRASLARGRCPPRLSRSGRFRPVTSVRGGFRLSRASTAPVSRT